MRVIGYLRVSSQEQAEARNGLNAQEAAITRHILERDWQLVDTVTDAGLSGASLDRPGLLEALRRIAAGEADCLLAAKLDRLTRSTADFAALLAWFQDANADMVALDMNVDTTTPAGKAMAQILAVFAEWERDVISQRTREGLAAVRAAGRIPGHPGVADHPEVAERVKTLHAEGFSMRGIAQVLNEEGWPTVRGGRQWYDTAVRSVLGRPVARKRPRATVLPAVGRRTR